MSTITTGSTVKVINPTEIGEGNDLYTIEEHYDGNLWIGFTGADDEGNTTSLLRVTEEMDGVLRKAVLVG